MAYYLEPISDGQQIVLDKAVLLVGRGSECDIVLTNSRKVSRKHCCIAQVNETYMLRDLSSMNGVRVNGRKVQRESVLEVGDEIAFADVRYVLRQTASNGSDPPPLPSAEGEPEPAYKSRPADISQKFPVPIADEGVDFAVDASIEVERSPLAEMDIESSEELPEIGDDGDPSQKDARPEGEV